MKKPKFNFDNYKYFNDNELPKLILGVKINPAYPYEEEYKFKEGKDWIKIAHQTAGHACHQYYFIATVLTPKIELIPKIKDICDEYLDSDIGCFGVNIQELNSYVDLLKNNLDVDCNWSYDNFEEGIYPIDYSIENLKKLTDDIFPADLDRLIDWKEGLKKYIGCVHRWGIYILGNNCD